MVMKQNETWQFDETKNKNFSIWTNHRTRDPSIFETDFKFKSISEDFEPKQRFIVSDSLSETGIKRPVRIGPRF